MNDFYIYVHIKPRNYEEFYYGEGAFFLRKPAEEGEVPHLNFSGTLRGSDGMLDVIFQPEI
jgi:hypothetical protein